MAFFRRSVGKVAPPPTLSTICDIMMPALTGLCEELSSTHGPLTAAVQVSHSSDAIQLVIIDSKGRKYLHPRFIERHETMDGNWIGLVRERFRDTADGSPSNRTYKQAAPAFSLEELEEAQEIMDSIK